MTASSSLAAEPGCGGLCYYVADNVKDSNTLSAWAEDVPGLGIGEHLDFDLGAQRRLTRMSIVAGWQRGEECIYVRNGRPSALRLTFDGGRTVEVSVPDDRRSFEVSIDAVTSKVTLTITGVWPPDSCGGRDPATDTLITEITFFERP